jgi:hypothetical protein
VIAESLALTGDELLWLLAHALTGAALWLCGVIVATIWQQRPAVVWDPYTGSWRAARSLRRHHGRR